MNPSLLLVALLLHASPALAQSIADPWQAPGTIHLRVTAETPQPPHEVRISPGRGLLFVFDAPVLHDGLVEEERKSFRQVSLSEDRLLLTLLPRSGLPLGKRLGLTVRFADGRAPLQLEFTLVVSSQAHAQVEVHRQPRPNESSQDEIEETQAQLQQCQTQLRQERTQREQPSGLLGMLALNRLGRNGVLGKSLVHDLALDPQEAFYLFGATSYRATGGDPEIPVVRLAVELLLQNKGTLPWTPARAQLVGPDGDWMAEVWPPEPLAPGETRRVLIEVERPGSKAPGPYQLKLWDEDGSRMATVSGVTFP